MRTLFIRLETSVMYPEFGTIQNTLCDSINQLLDYKDYGDGISLEWLLVVRIKEEKQLGYPMYKPIARYYPKKKALIISFNMDYELLWRGNVDIYLQLMCEGILHTISRFKELKVKNFNSESFYQDVESLFLAKGWLKGRLTTNQQDKLLNPQETSPSPIEVNQSFDQSINIIFPALLPSLCNEAKVLVENEINQLLLTANYGSRPVCLSFFLYSYPKDLYEKTQEEELKEGQVRILDDNDLESFVISVVMPFYEEIETMPLERVKETMQKAIIQGLTFLEDNYKFDKLNLSKFKADISRLSPN